MDEETRADAEVVVFNVKKGTALPLIAEKEHCVKVIGYGLGFLENEVARQSLSVS